MSEQTKYGIDRDNLDPAIRPQDDFYQYACGGWMKNHPLLPEFSRFGTFDMLRENAREQLKQLITELDSNPDSRLKGTNAQKVRDVYALAIDAARLNAEGAAPLRPMLEHLNGFTRNNLEETVAWIMDGITSVLFSVGVGPDPADSNMNILHIGETGLGLGDRDYYLEPGEENERIMKAYVNYVETIMRLAGFSEEEARRIRENVIRLETEIARHKMTREQRRQPALRYNMMTLDDIRKRYAGFDWDRFFRASGIDGVESANIVSPDYLDFIIGRLPELSERELLDYFIFNVVADSSGLLSDDFYNADFEMYDRVMSGKEEQEPRWKRAMAMPNSMFGEAVGQLYVERYFPEANKQYMLRLVDNLKTALGEHIDSAAWMSNATKAKAREKLADFTVKIGYPDKWKDYSGIQIDPEKSYLENVYAASRWYRHDNLSKLGQPVDKEEWHMTPQTVNAYYSPVSNEICFPAAILQPPYFDPKADDALNYGAIGVVIGHEMTHGFDDQGRQFDKEGNLHDWWEEADAKAFTALSDILTKQFDAIEVAPGVHANGKYTLGENIADQGGLRIAMTAYRNACKGKEPENIDGFTPEQRFYLSYAGVWAGNIRDEEILVRTKTDPHSLGRLRVNATLRNIEPFFSAFGIKEGDPMWRPEEERVIIW